MVLLLIPALPLLAQLANNTVTVTASQNSTAQPDEAVFSVAVISRIDKTLDDVVAAVSSLGITAANLVSFGFPLLPCATLANSPNCPLQNLQWTFQLIVPFSQTE
jgi:hypothetical protein